MIIAVRKNEFPNLPLFDHPRPLAEEFWIECRSIESLELLGRLPDRGLAVVGTRRPGIRAEAFTRQLLLGLRTRDFVILSGLARGIDRIAHEAALEAGLPTIAVLGCGLDHHYPPESEPLRRRVVNAGGLVISEFAPHIPPVRHQFVKRNRCLAAWSRAVCVMEAPARSGALITADYALERHVPVFAVPAFPGEAAYAGNQRLLDEHSALALWGTHSLGAVWLELAALPPQPQLLELFPQVKTHHLQRLIHWAVSARTENGPILEQILPLAESAGWSSALTFATWDKATSLGMLSDKNAQALKNPSSSP